MCPSDANRAQMSGIPSLLMSGIPIAELTLASVQLLPNGSSPLTALVASISELRSTLPAAVPGGSLTRWTRFDDAVVLEEPFLTGDPDRPPRVHVVVADPALLAGSDFVKSLPYPIFSTLGQGFPELPARWV